MGWHGVCEVEGKSGWGKEVFLEWQVKCGSKWNERFLRQEVWRGWGGGRWRRVCEKEISRGGQWDTLDRSGVQ